MSTMPNTGIAQAWNSFRVATFAGQHDSHIKTGEDYATTSLASVFTMQPQCKPKMAGDAILASSYADYDARSHDAQRNNGSFVALVGDVDNGNLGMPAIRAAVEAFADGAAWLIYSSAHSRDGDQRWRILFPLCQPCGFSEWHDAQCALFAFMEDRGIPMDHALARAGQPIYLPNVPERYKDGTPLRDADGQPFFYQHAHSGIDLPGIDIKRGIVAGGIAALRRQQVEDDRQREEMRKIAEAKYASRPQRSGGNLIEQFNASTSVDTMLSLCGYQQSPKRPEDWRSPQQTGETYATRVIDGKWFSLSGSDAASGLGQKCKAGCFGDAYDLYVHFKHNGDHKEAYRAIGREQSGSNVVHANFRGDDQDPGYQEMPEWAQRGDEPDYELMVGVEEGAPAPADDDLVFELLDIAELEALPPPTWLVHEFVADHGLSIIYGAPGAGKTFFALDMSLRIAHGMDWHGAEVKQSGVLYIAGEGARGIGKRVKGWRMEHGIQEASAPFLVLPVPVQMLEDNDRRKLLRTIEAAIARIDCKVGLVVIDTVSRSIAGQDENGQESMTLFVNACNAVQNFTGGAVLGVHHSGKDAARGMRGSTVLLGGCDASIKLEKAEDGRISVEVEKQKDAEQGEPILMSMKKVEWPGDDGKDVSTLVPYRSNEHAITARQLTLSEVREIFAAITDAWVAKAPWSVLTQSKRRGRYLPAKIAETYGVSEETAFNYCVAWQENNLLVTDMCDPRNKVMGLRVLRVPA